MPIAFGVRRPNCVPALIEEITMDWRDKSACLTVDPELFFPVGNTGPALDQIEKAKQVCAQCPVVENCLQSVSYTHLTLPTNREV